MKAKPRQKKDNSERWLLTYSDLITLLMILFVLLFAMSNVSQEKYEKLSESLSSSMGEGASVLNGSAGIFDDGGGDNILDIGTPKGEGDGQKGGNVTASKAPSATPVPKDNEVSVTPIPTEAPKTGDTNQMEEIGGSLVGKNDMEKFENYVTEIISEMGVGLSASTRLTESGLMISFNNDVFFDSGQDVLKEEMKSGLKEIATLLNKIDNSIIIEGHTDNVPINNDNKYTSNWQLSAARAANVAQYLVEKEKVDGSRISAIGYGEYRPIAKNDTNKGRRKNRRVDIIILYNSRSEVNYNK